MTHQFDHAIASVLVVSDDSFLLVRETRPGREGLYNFPGGHLDMHETIFQAAIREVKEETGYDVELTGLIGIYQTIYPHTNVSGPIFSAVIIGGEATPTPEHPETIWVSRDELHDMAKAGRLFTAFPPQTVDHYLSRGTYPLDIVVNCDHKRP